MKLLSNVYRVEVPLRLLRRVPLRLLRREPLRLPPVVLLRRFFLPPKLALSDDTP